MEMSTAQYYELHLIHNRDNKEKREAIEKQRRQS
jgi:hypothetical protein